jgi:hypothetical protein
VQKKKKKKKKEEEEEDFSPYLPCAFILYISNV